MLQRRGRSVRIGIFHCLELTPGSHFKSNLSYTDLQICPTDQWCCGQASASFRSALVTGVIFQYRSLIAFGAQDDPWVHAQAAEDVCI